jgi:hypothetical protein
MLTVDGIKIFTQPHKIIINTTNWFTVAREIIDKARNAPKPQLMQIWPEIIKT